MCCYNYLCARVPDIFDLFVDEVEVPSHVHLMVVPARSRTDLLSHNILLKDLVELVLTK